MTLTAEQKTLRRGRVTASNVAACLGLDRYKSPRQAWEEIYLGVEQPVTLPMRAGTALEPVILDLFAESMPDEEIVGRQVWRDDDPKHLIAATLDARLRKPRAVEAKTAGVVSYGKVDEWGEEGTDEIPEQYVVQCTAQMIAAPELELVYVPAIVRGDFRIYQVPRNDALLGMIREGIARFIRDHIETGEPPPADYRDLDAVKVYRSHAGFRAPLPPDLVESYHGLGERIKAMEEHRGTLGAQIRDLLGAAQADDGDCPGWSVTNRKCKDGEKLDDAKLRNEFPAAYAACLVPKPGHRTLRVTRLKGGR